MARAEHQTRWWNDDKLSPELRRAVALLSPSLRRAALMALLAAAYFIVARLGLSLGAVGKFATVVWPATGVALSALFLGGARLWPGVFIGATLVNASLGAPIAAATTIGLGNTLEAVLGVHLLHRAGFDAGLGRLKDVLLLVLGGALFPAMVSATIGVGVLLLAGPLSYASADNAWFAWWWGDVMGVLVVTPLILTSAGGSWRAALRRWHEAALVYASVIVGALFIFGGFGEPSLLRVYLLFPPLIWVALRFGPFGAALGTLLVSMVGIPATVLGRGPFVEPTLTWSLIDLQLFIGVVAATSLLLAASVKERNHRDEVISVAAHELRNPIAVMQLQLERMDRCMEEGWPTERIAPIAFKLSVQLNRLTKLVEALLDIARARAAALTLETEHFDLAALVEENVANMSEPLAKAGCDVEQRLEPAHGCWDRVRLGQVVIILLSNAINYAPGAPISVMVRADGNVARLVVKDHGPGIPERNRDKIFEPFERAGGERFAKGLGLGLHIARQIVRAHRGTIRVESEVGHGAAFIVELPLEGR